MMTPTLYLYFVLPLALLAFYVHTTTASTSDTQQRFVLEPQNLTAVVGTKVVVPCRVENLSGLLQWVQNDFGLGNLTLPHERYEMTRGGEKAGDFSLEIDPVALEDEGYYECQVLGGDPPNLRSRNARLTVLVPPEAPKIIQGSSFETVAESEMTLECVSSGGKPAAKISWIVADRGVLTAGVTHSEEPINGSDLHTSRSVLTFTAKKHHHKTTFVCRVQHVAEQFARSTGIQLQVRFAPVVTVSVVGTNPYGWIEEGSDIRVVCHADANPSNVSYKWFMDGRLSRGNSSELVFRNVSRSLHGLSVRCRARNQLGESEDSLVLNVSYGPLLRREPFPVYSGDNGSTVTMSCDADGRPSPDIRWFFIHSDSSHETVVGTSSNLTLKVVSNNTGRYYCKARVIGFPEITAKSAQLLLNGRPEILSIRSQLATTGEVLVECEAISLPKYDNVTWSLNGKELSGGGVYYDIKERDLFPTGIKSVLTIKGAAGNITGMYSCSVTNAYGTDSVQIYLIPPKEAETFPLVLVLGVTGGSVLFVVLLVVLVGVILCRRYRTPSAKAFKPLPVGDTKGDQLCRQTSDLSSNVSVMKTISPQGSFMSQPMSEVYIERPVDVLPPAISAQLSSTLSDNHIIYATGNRVSTFSPQSVRQQDVQNSTYVSYDQVSEDEIPSCRINDMPNVCRPETFVPLRVVDSMTPFDANGGLPLSRCPSATSTAPTDSRLIQPPYGMPCRQCSSESMQLPPPHTTPAVSTPSEGPRSTSPSRPHLLHPHLFSAAVNEAALQMGFVPNSTTSQVAVPSPPTGTLRLGVKASIV